MKNITLLGSTGSIGTQALDVIKKQNFGVSALVAGSNIDLLEKQIREFSPEVAVICDEAKFNDLKVKTADTKTKILCGKDAVCEVASKKCDIVLNSIVGIAGLKPTVLAIEAGNDIALANKETLVAGGDIVMELARQKGVTIYPVDSEHSAIFQCLQGSPKGALRKILLTASGGPFFGKTAQQLINITPAQALKHPNWNMGRKISIDSATLMNKGLEVIEAVHLFGVSAKDIEVLVHRQSVVHSAVEFADGGVIAQMGVPDMRLPIQYALTYPNRYACGEKPLNLFDYKTLTFEQPDIETFKCLDICKKAINDGGIKPAVVNGANEAAVDLFLNEKISFLDIGEIISEVYSLCSNVKSFTLNDIFEADNWARETVYNIISRK